MFCILWKGTLILHQIFIIFSCIQMALILIKYLPEWTTWVGAAFEATGAVRVGPVGDATARVMSMRELVDFAAKWFAANRR